MFYMRKIKIDQLIQLFILNYFILNEIDYLTLCNLKKKNLYKTTNVFDMFIVVYRACHPD